MAQSKRWVVTALPGRQLGEVVRELRQAGFDVEEQLDAIGVVTGVADDAVAERLKGVSGVADVSPDAPIDIGPPDSDRTW